MSNFESAPQQENTELWEKFAKDLSDSDVSEKPEFENNVKVEEEKNPENQNFFAGNVIFSDIDATITDNSGKISERAVKSIKDFVKQGGNFVPVTGRARFESVKSLMETLDLPLIVMDNGAEIFNRHGERIFGSELSQDEVESVFEIADKHGLTWMQHKKDPETGKEHLYSNFTEESERAMLDAGIVDTVHNEEGRIGLQAKSASTDEVTGIPGQNYKIQMMSPDFEAVRAAYEELQAKDIPCFLNMQSPKTGEYHWVEAIRGTKTSGIQNAIDRFLPDDIKNIITLGDGGNDIPMLTGDFHDKNGQPIPNKSIAVGNASEKVKDVTSRSLQSSYNTLQKSTIDGERHGLAPEIVIRALKLNILRQNAAKASMEKSDSDLETEKTV